MTLQEAENAIFQKFTNEWTETSIAYENIEFDTSAVTEFVRITINYAASEEPFLRGCGVLGKRFNGNIIVQVFIPMNKGSERRQVLTQAVSDILAQQNINVNVHTDVSTDNKIGVSGKFYQTNVVIPFNFENIITV